MEQPSRENLAPGVIKRVFSEVKKLESQPLEGITVKYDAQDISVIYATIQGPVSTPYEGGVFKVKLNFTPEYPNQPPIGYFLTKIFHPNVSKDGQICVNTLKKDWKADLELSHIFLVIRCLLIEPNPESALNEEAGKLLLEQYNEFAKHAKLWTEIYAAAENKSNAENIFGPHQMEKKEDKSGCKKEGTKRRSLKRL